MTLPWLLYLLDICNSLSGLLVFIIVVSSMALFGVVIYLCSDERGSEVKAACMYYLKRIIPIAILIVLIPSKTTLLTFISYDYLKTSTLPPKLLQVIEIKLDDIINKQKQKDK
jgi:hypothetical protein